MARASGLGITGARWAAAFAAFGSGISGLATLTHPGGDVVRGADLAYAESVFSSTFYAYPYHTVAYALLVLSVAGAVSLAGTMQSPRASLRRGPAIALVALTAALSATHPYEAVMVVASVVGSAAVAGMAGRRRDARHRLVAGSICARGAAPSFLYSAWLSSQPVWSEVAAKTLANAQPRLAWVLGYGAPGMLAVLGVVRGVRARGAINLDWALSWLLLLTLLLMVLAVPQAKVASGGYLPVAVAAGAAMENWGSVGQRSRLLSARLLRGIALGGIVAVSVSSFVFLLAIVLRPRHFDGEFSHIARRMGDMGTAPVTVLAPTDAGVLPALGNIRVYAGQWYLTDRYEEKVERLRASGFEAAGPGGGFGSTRGVGSGIRGAGQDGQAPVCRHPSDTRCDAVRGTKPPAPHGRVSRTVVPVPVIVVSVRGGRTRAPTPATPETAWRRTRARSPQPL